MPTTTPIPSPMPLCRITKKMFQNLRCLIRTQICKMSRMRIVLYPTALDLNLVQPDGLNVSLNRLTWSRKVDQVGDVFVYHLYILVMVYSMYQPTKDSLFCLILSTPKIQCIPTYSYKKFSQNHCT